MATLMEPRALMASICQMLSNCSTDLQSLESEFGPLPSLFVNPGGRRKTGQVHEAKCLRDALDREVERMKWLQFDLLEPGGNKLHLVPDDQRNLAIDGLYNALNYLKSRICVVIQDYKKRADSQLGAKAFRHADMAALYRNMNHFLHSAMAQAGRAAKILRHSPACTWSKHQCHEVSHNLGVDSLKLIPPDAHPPHVEY
ncbi:uncharacterized protein LY89DRAFT_783196 [Mollisia scopiformis]|uniref:Uncharacterized protein n=1 Tax=Mollisia scopiformis TaxID=149040 RepID=A0A194X704_MOLSC|nr:uncharacterized protein LY89DRAFT_783196 [Mollisia scopiformis]KUJ15955.1 hypothetical protein LY89DRAFT_783196 [Mollisia scopiformis]